jgi:glycosyltransferase involved in cell wall biosynthesis
MTTSLDVVAIIPVYNGERCVPEAITSAFGQTMLPKEIVVVDDGPSNGMVEIQSQFGNNVRFVRIANAGLAAARIIGVASVKSDYVADCNR